MYHKNGRPRNHELGTGRIDSSKYNFKRSLKEVLADPIIQAKLFEIMFGPNRIKQGTIKGAYEFITYYLGFDGVVGEMKGKVLCLAKCIHCGKESLKEVGTFNANKSSACLACNRNTAGKHRIRR